MGNLVFVCVFVSVLTLLFVDRGENKIRFYLSLASTLDVHGGAHTQELFTELTTCADTVVDALDLAQDMEHSTNFVAADRGGNIGYQQTGAVPLRAQGGIFPVAGFQSKNLWRGRAPGSHLGRIVNPPGGVIVTANGFHEARDGAPVDSLINMHMGEDRVKRIEEILEAAPGGPTLQTLKAAQLDLESRQARAFLPILRQSLAAAESMALERVDGRLRSSVKERAALLSSWDAVYDAESRAAVLFEGFYREWLQGTMKRWFRPEAQEWPQYLVLARTVFFHRWDALLVNESSLLYEGGKSRDQVVAEALAAVLSDQGVPGASPNPTLREWRSAMMTNMLFAGKLGKIGSLLGIDHGPVSLLGSRSTPCQGHVARKNDGTESAIGVGPSWRMVTDMETDVVETAIPGGASGNFVSRWFTNRIAGFFRGEYDRMVVGQ
jgi:penicillin G amidase